MVYKEEEESVSEETEGVLEKAKMLSLIQGRKTFLSPEHRGSANPEKVGWT